MSEQFDFVAAAGNLKGTSEQLPWFDADTGNYKVSIISDPVRFQSKSKFSDTGFQEKIRVEVVVKQGGKVLNDGKPMSWGVNVAQGVGSLYGQLVLLGREWGGLAGKEVTMTVLKESNKRKFVIAEAVDVLQAQQAVEEEEVVG